MGKIFKILLLICVILVGYLYQQFAKTRPQRIPIPYELPAVDSKEIAKAEQAHILLIGDHSFEITKPSLKRIIDEQSKNFKDAIKVVVDKVISN